MAKSKSYTRRRISEAFKETDRPSDIVQDVAGGIMTAISAVVIGFAKSDELGELTFLTLGGAIFTFILKFLFAFFVTAPGRLHKEQEKKIKSLESKLSQRGDLEQTNVDATSDNERQKVPIYITILLACVSCCLFLLVFQSAKNFRAQRQRLSPKKEAILKPLPTKTIPRPEPPPVVAPQEAQTQEVATAGETTKPFEDFKLDAITNSGAIARYEEKLANIAKEKAKTEQEREVQARKYWPLDLPHHRYALTVLHDSLLQYATQRNDGISQSTDFLQCFPETLGSKTGEFKAGEIRLQKDTNVDFTVSVDVLNGGNHRAIKITSKAGTLLMGRNADTEWHYELHIFKPDYFEITQTNYEHANDIIKSSIEDLIGAQEYNF